MGGSIKDAFAEGHFRINKPLVVMIKEHSYCFEALPIHARFKKVGHQLFLKEASRRDVPVMPFVAHLQGARYYLLQVYASRLPEACTKGRHDDISQALQLLNDLRREKAVPEGRERLFL
ncbi:MAG: hypothetical protein A4E57_04316 [Syntrophorhabdaceae bacterium PtaU1.Bin034]|nr:MAG: hypothetical protein A4E57_04316 [Syntrophorhabdaceae bacterium PtaU1.Bin034]